MTATLIAGPLVEPVSIGEVRSWLRVDNAEDDVQIATLIAAARLAIERATRLALISQTWRITLDRWPKDGVLHIPLAPFQSLVSFVTYDASRTATSVSSSAYTLDSAPLSPRIRLEAALLQPGLAMAGVELQVVVGFGPDGASVPAPLRQAIKQLVANGFEHRGDDIGRMPEDVRALIAPYRRMRLS